MTLDFSIYLRFYEQLEMAPTFKKSHNLET